MLSLMSVASASLAQIKALPPDSPERREAVRNFLRDHPNLRKNAAERVNVDPSVVSRVLHGSHEREDIDKAIEAEERKAK
jgi:hypothetical protein